MARRAPELPFPLHPGLRLLHESGGDLVRRHHRSRPSAAGPCLQVGHPPRVRGQRLHRQLEQRLQAVRVDCRRGEHPGEGEIRRVTSPRDYGTLEALRETGQQGSIGQQGAAPARIRGRVGRARLGRARGAHRLPLRRPPGRQCRPPGRGAGRARAWPRPPTDSIPSCRARIPRPGRDGLPQRRWASRSGRCSMSAPHPIPRALPTWKMTTAAVQHHRQVDGNARERPPRTELMADGRDAVAMHGT